MFIKLQRFQGEPYWYIKRVLLLCCIMKCVYNNLTNRIFSLFISSLVYWIIPKIAFHLCVFSSIQYYLGFCCTCSCTTWLNSSYPFFEKNNNQISLCFIQNYKVSYVISVRKSLLFPKFKSYSSWDWNSVIKSRIAYLLHVFPRINLFLTWGLLRLSGQ